MRSICGLLARSEAARSHLSPEKRAKLETFPQQPEQIRCASRNSHPALHPRC